MNRILLRAILFAVLVSQPIFAQTGPRLSDPEFFGRLDWTCPDLAVVHEAVERADWPTARHALADYIRHRPMPHWEIDPFAVGRNPSFRSREADEALQHHFDSLGMEWQFGPVIDWKFNPTTQPDSKWPRNHEWTWQFNRHTYWESLARAYYATGDEKYAREFAAELRSWVQECPVPMDHAANQPFSAWRTIEAGIRAGSIWPEIFPRVLAAKSFDDDTLVLMLKSFVDHAEYLMKFPTGGNWLTMEANGLYNVGALFPEFTSASLWRKTAIERLDHELDAQVYPDGAQNELTPGYHALTIHNFMEPVKLIPVTGFKLPEDYLPKLEKMYAYLLYSMEPDEKTPPLNDSGSSDIATIMTEGAKFFPERKDFLWAATRGHRGTPPAETSHFFPYAGQYFMRSGWDPQARWLCMDGGPFGARHQHEDKLSVILTAYGTPLLVEAGTYTYDASDWRRYVLSSRAHNVTLVDGMGQGRYHEPKSTFVVQTPLPHVWESNDQFDHAASRYDEGWGDRSAHPLRQTRHVFFVKPDFFVVADQLESLDGKPHQCESLFHLNADEADIHGLRVATKNDGPNLTVMAYGADSVKIIKGQKTPEVQGWLPVHTLGYGGIKPIPTAVYTKKVKKNATVLYVLYPSAKGEEFPISNVKISTDTLTIQYKEKPDQVIRFQPYPARPSLP